MKSIFSSRAMTVQGIATVKRLSLIVIAFFFWDPVPVLAAEQEQLSPRDTLYFTTPPGAQQIGRHLFPEALVARRTRGISFTQPEQTAKTDKSVGMPILFHFGKTTIVQQSRAFLDNVGEMMISPQYADRTLIVEGHTDAVGSDKHNQRLSELRALAIKQYLVNQFDIDPLRLFPSGKGESVLYEPQQPKAGVNRRVEFLPYKNG